jgi:putative Ca2+/H+ antiporter (TMEM165/GDT1 family)
MLEAAATIFVTVFLAELGDKTQLATLLFAADRAHPPLLVFLAAAGALIASTGLATVLGYGAARHLESLPLPLIAGAGFIAIGIWTIWDYLKAAG